MSLALLRRCNPGGFLLSFFHKHTGLLEVLTIFLFYFLNCHTAFNMTLPPHRRTTCWLSTSQLGSETLTRKQQMTTCRSQRVSKCQILWDGVMLVMLPACPGASHAHIMLAPVPSLPTRNSFSPVAWIQADKPRQPRSRRSSQRSSRPPMASLLQRRPGIC